MFLKSSSLLITMTLTLLTLSSRLALATAELPGLEAGRFELRQGPKNLCSSFSLTEKEVKGAIVSLGGKYTLKLKNSAIREISDLDPKCEFIEQNSKSTNGRETTVTRTNSEICNRETVVSRITSKVTFKGSSIVLEHTIFEGGMTDTYPCIWNRVP